MPVQHLKSSHTAQHEGKDTVCSDSQELITDMLATSLTGLTWLLVGVGGGETRQGPQWHYGKDHNGTMAGTTMVTGRDHNGTMARTTMVTWHWSLLNKHLHCSPCFLPPLKNKNKKNSCLNLLPSWHNAVPQHLHGLRRTPGHSSKETR